MQSANTNINALVNFLTHVSHLKQLPRTGWLFANVSQPESVADHTCGMALLALMLAEQVNVDWATLALTAPLDVGHVARLALVHDLAESLLTDLPHRSTQLLSKAVKHGAEEAAMHDLYTKLPNGDSYAALWAEYDSASTPEARLVKDADKLDMVHQALRYELRGHTNLQEFWEGHRWHYAVSKALFDALSARRPINL